MLNSHWLILPFLLQMLCLAVDEFLFHRKRGLPRWERIGHPLDTSTVVLCLAWIVFTEPDRRTVSIYLVLALFSCVFVTKDEHVHRRLCSSAEQWLHSLLFMLHPIVLTSAGLLWPAAWNSASGYAGVLRPSGFERPFLISAFALMSVVGICQFVFWNLLWRPQKAGL